MELGELESSAVFQWLGDLGIRGASDFTSSSAGCLTTTAWSSSGGTVEEAVRLLVAGGPLRHEVEFVLAEFLGREYRSHLAILDAVARGATKLEQIASHVGIKTTSLTPYLRDLTELLGILTRFKARRTY